MADESKDKKSVKLTLPHLGWKHLSVVLIVALAVSLYVIFTRENIPVTGMSVALTPQEAANKAITWISDYYAANGQTVSIKLVNTTETNGVYKFVAELSSSQGNVQSTFYVSKDGKLFLPQGIDITEEIQQPESEEVPKTDKPTVELFVMSFCPYGVQAENIMKPVVDLLGEKADIKVRFITTIQGDTVDSVNSLHGTTEAQEDLRQVCIMNYYGQETFWNYLMGIDNNCYGTINTGDAAALDTCWKSAATAASIDISKISTCSNSTEGLDLLKADEQLTQLYGVSGSPTLVINGVVYSGSRDSESFKQAICSAFNTAPDECSQTLSASSASSSSGTTC